MRFGPCPWVCEVRVFGHTHTRSQQKALLAAQIALAAISLAWDTPSQQTKETGLIYEIGPERSRHTITFSKASVVETGSHSVLRLGRFLDDRRRPHLLQQIGSAAQRPSARR